MEIHETLYCEMCGWPVSYCQFQSIAKQKEFGCKQWLLENNQEAYVKIYGEIPIVEKVEVIQPNESEPDVEKQTNEKPETKQKQNQSNDENSEEYSESEDDNNLPKNLKQIENKPIPPFGITIKPSIKKSKDYIPTLQVRLTSRGNRKWITQIWNYEDFSDKIEAKKVCHELAKRHAGSCSVTQSLEGAEEIIALQGSFVEEVVAYFEQLGISRSQIHIAAKQKHKGRKKAAKPQKANQGHQQRGAQ